jgi:SecD/SecF fusion protein
MDMNSKHAVWKWLLLAIITVFSVYVVMPPEKKIRLGLDLQGGVSFTVQIDKDKLHADFAAADPKLDAEALATKVDAAMKDADERILEVLRNRIDGLGTSEPLIMAGADHRILIQIPGTNEWEFAAAEESLKKAAFLEFRLVHKNNQKLVDALFTEGRKPRGYEIVDVAGRNYYQRTEAFRTVVKDPGYDREMSTFHTPDPLYEFLLEETRMKNGQTLYFPHFVLRKVEMTGNTIERADINRDPMTGAMHVGLSFSSRGKTEFARLTARYAPNGPGNLDSTVGRQLAIVLDGTLYSAPVINEPIPSGRASISGSFTARDAAILRNTLNAGALPAPVKIIEKRAVGPTLGSDAINSGVKAAVIGTLAVILFMGMYYLYCGLIANVALLANLVLMPAGMIIAGGLLSVFVRDSGISNSVLQLPVLTLPGIAGIVLSIGMAVDANVLIYERMREEFRLGKTVRAAVAAGYDRAFLAILDSNLTTLLTGVILFIFGSGPIRGFAVTLSAGLIVSMYTALVLTRMVFDATVSETRVKPFRMLKLIGETSYDFLAKRKPAMLASLAVIVISWGCFAGRVARDKNAVLGVDFTGGASVTLSYGKQADLGKVRKALADAGIPDAAVQYQKSLESGAGVLEIKSSYTEIAGAPTSKRVQLALDESMPDMQFKVIGEEMIGPAVGKDLRNGAIKAIIISLIGMIIYITVRFQFGFALGAIAALAHDVLVTFGIFTLLGRQVNLTTVAALLTIVGYSINDTIVIFDRIREDMRLDQRSSFIDVINRAMNQTLSRTLLTTFVTMLAVFSLLIFGGGSIRDFALTMIIGMIAGTYSTLFIATPVMVAWYKGRRPGFAADGKKA